MRAKLIHHSAEWLAEDYQAPPELTGRKFLTVWHFTRNSRAGLTAMKVDRGAGLWDSSGHLLFYSKHVADLAWSRTDAGVYSLEIRFGPCREAAGVRHALRRLEPETFKATGETELCVPMGAVE